MLRFLKIFSPKNLEKKWPSLNQVHTSIL
jgi:hypothetical protein